MVRSEDTEFVKLREQFIVARVLNMRDVDIANIQFDFDLVFSVIFMNGHGEIYSRYGGRTPWNAESRVSFAGLQYTMRKVLAIHDSDLRPTRAAAKPMLTRELPGLDRSCVHCHQVWEGLRRKEKIEGRFTEASLFVFPRPENIGLTLDVDAGNRVSRVKSGSAGAIAGLLPGDEIQRIENAPICSQADVSWALHNAPDVGSAKIHFTRAGLSRTVRLGLEPFWKESNLSWRPSMRKEELPERHRK